MREGSLIMERFSRKKNVNKALKQIKKLRTNKKLKGTKKKLNILRDSLKV